MKTRKEVVSECEIAVAGCWNHYSDVPLVAKERHKIGRNLYLLLPPEIKTTQWQEDSDAYDKEMAEQEEEEVV